MGGFLEAFLQFFGASGAPSGVFGRLLGPDGRHLPLELKISKKLALILEGKNRVVRVANRQKMVSKRR